MTWHIEKYWCPTITSDQIIGGSPFRFADDTGPPWSFTISSNCPSPTRTTSRSRSYMEDTPIPITVRLPAAARAAFRELKFGVRIHWGVYSELGKGVNASWPFLTDGPRTYAKPISNSIGRFNPTNFNADAWMDLFQTNSIKLVAFTTKHHDGFSMFDTHTRVLTACQLDQ